MRLWAAVSAVLVFATVAGAASHGARKATKESIADTEPAWSPSGARLAFVRVRSVGTGFDYHVTHADIYSARADGSQLRRLTWSGWNYGPSWMPDGKTIIYTRASRPSFDPRSGPTARSAFYTINAADGTVRRFGSWIGDGAGNWLATPRVARTNRLAFVTSAPGTGLHCRQGFCATVYMPGTRTSVSGRDPEWSPGGTKLAYTARGLETVDADGTNRHVVYENAFEGRACYPSWSPNGRRIVVSGGLNRCDGGIFIVNSGGGGFTSLGLAGSDPAWSPKGDRIVFVARQRLYVMSPNGTGVHEFLLRRSS